ncbi:MAG: metallophosphoesterase [Alistipes sp.]|nr:metallophosphoesterase [Alistipes sp.]
MKRLLFSLALVLCAVNLFADELPKTADIKCGPWVTGVTETEMTIVWTSTSRCMGWVEVAPDDGTSFYAEERPKFYEDFLGRHIVSEVHHIRLTNLKPGTVYRYRLFQQCIDDRGHSPIPLGRVTASNVYSRQPFAVRTLDKSKEEIRFTMINDIHGRDEIMDAHTKDIPTKKPDFVVFNGDMASFMGSIADIEKDFMIRASKNFSADFPLVYVRGNHETRGPGYCEFMNLFPSATGTPSYTFFHGPAAFVVLDCGEDKPDSDIEYGGTAAYDAYREQIAKWLKEATSSEEFKSAPVKIALMHIPFEKNAGWWGNNELKRLLLPLLNEAGIDVMLSGHNHVYSFREKGSMNGNDFPILVNNNNDRVEVKVTRNEIKMDVVDTSGNVLHQHTIKVE